MYIKKPELERSDHLPDDATPLQVHIAYMEYTRKKLTAVFDNQMQEAIALFKKEHAERYAQARKKFGTLYAWEQNSEKKAKRDVEKWLSTPVVIAQNEESEKTEKIMPLAADEKTFNELLWKEIDRKAALLFSLPA